jgi:hypothetical protein
MADGVFNIAKGAVAEKIRDSAANVGVLLLKANETVSAMIDRATIAALLAASNTEADFTNYARKTGLTGTVTVDNTNDRVDVDIDDQTWTSAGGATNNTLTKAIVYYQESGADSGRIPLTHHDFALTTDSSDITLQVNASGFFRAY